MRVSTPSPCLNKLAFSRLRRVLWPAVLVSALSAAGQTPLPPALFTGWQSTVAVTGLSAPAGDATDSLGNLYIADTGNNRIVEFTTAGVQSTVLSGTVLGMALKAPNAVALDNAGDLYVADSGNNRVLEITSKGVSSTVGTGLANPSGLAYGGGLLMIADTGNDRIVAVNSNAVQTTVIASTATPGGTKLSSPTGLNYSDYEGSGYLYVADTGNNRVVYGAYASYSPFSYAGTLGTGLSKPRGVVGLNANAGAAGAYYYIADTGNNRAVYDVEDSFYSFQSQDPIGTGLKSPGGLALDSRGNLYIADTGNNRILEVRTSAVDFGVTSVGKASTQTLEFLFTAAVTLNAQTPVEPLTLGVSSVDFKLAAGGTCGAKAFAAGASCTVQLEFKPTVAGERRGAVELLDNSGNILIALYVVGVGGGPQIVYDPGVQTTVVSGLSAPRGLAVDAEGNIFIADFGMGELLKQTPAGVQSIVAVLPSPRALALDGAGNLYTASSIDLDLETGIYEITPAGAVTDINANDSIDPLGIAVDGYDDIYWADAYEDWIWIDLAAANPFQETTLGTLGGFAPNAAAVDYDHNLYIVDSSNWLVWKYTPAGDWSTIGAGYNRPQDVAVDGAGDVFVADFGNDRVVEVTPAGVQTTVGTGLSEPTAVALDGKGDVYIADFGNNRVVKVDRSTPPSLSFASTAVGKTSSDSPRTVTVANAGTASLVFPPPASGKNASISADFKLGSATTCPVLGSASEAADLAAGDTCNYLVSFTPAVKGAISGSLVLTDNTLNVAGAKQTISLKGTGTAAAVKLSWPTPAAISAGTALTEKQLDARAAVPGTFVYSPAPGSRLAKGTHELSATFTPTDTEKYKRSTATVQLVVK